MHTGQLPKPPYVPDGTEMVSDDYFELIHDAGSLERLREHFVERFEVAARRHGDPATPEDTRQAWVEYLSGEYFVCLKRATPENIVHKGWLVPRIEQLMRDHEPTIPIGGLSSIQWWRSSTRWNGSSQPMTGSGSVRRARGSG